MYVGIKRDKSIKIVTKKKTKRDIATGEAKLRAVMVEREYPTNCIAVPLVRHCYSLIKERRHPWKSRITRRLRKYFPISRRVERYVGKELSRIWHHPAGEISRKTMSAAFDCLAKYNAELRYILSNGLFDESGKFRAKLK